MAKIVLGWAPYNTDSSNGLLYLFSKPENVYNKHIKDGEYKHKQCPATIELTRKTFVIESPFDAHFILDADKRTLELIPPCNLPEKFFHIRKGQYGDKDFPVVSMNFYQLFVTEDKDVSITITSPWFEESVNPAFRVVPGRFSISDWWRPLDFAMQLHNRRQEVKIKKGDPLYYVDVHTKNPEDSVIIKEIELDPPLVTFIQGALDYKFFRPMCPLKTLYGAFNQYTKRKHRPKLKFLE